MSSIADGLPSNKRLLELPIAIRLLLETRRLEMGHARALLTLAPGLASSIINSGDTARP